MRISTLLAVAGIAAGALWAANTSMFSSGGKTRLLAHRGVHQTFDIAKVDAQSCTATMIASPRHGFLENTIPSMRAAFEAGADVVELDVHLTPDGKFAVFHDWTLDCRTNATGETRQTSMAVLKTFDIGYGYTADGGKTFPFRGKGVGLMPTLSEVFEAFPEGRFLVNYKSDDSEEGTALAELLKRRPEFRSQVYGVYGGSVPTRAAIAAAPGLRGYDKASIKACLLRYILIGWTGYVPDACRNTIIVAPVNVAPWLWGFPHRLTARLKAAGTDFILLGRWSGGPNRGIDTVSELDWVPAGLDGLVWTNRIEIIGPTIAGPASP